MKKRWLAVKNFVIEWTAYGFSEIGFQISDHYDEQVNPEQDFMYEYEQHWQYRVAYWFMHVGSKISGFYVYGKDYKFPSSDEQDNV